MAIVFIVIGNLAISSSSLNLVYLNSLSISYLSCSSILRVPGGHLAFSASNSFWSFFSAFSWLNFWRYFGTLPYPFLNSTYSFAYFGARGGLGPWSLTAPPLTLSGYLISSFLPRETVLFWDPYLDCLFSEFLLCWIYSVGSCCAGAASTFLEALWALWASKIASNSATDLPL